MVKLSEVEKQMIVVDLNASLDEVSAYDTCGLCDHQAKAILDETYEQMGMGDEGEIIRVINHPMYQCLNRRCKEISYPSASDIDFDRRIGIKLGQMGYPQGLEHFKSLALKHEINSALRKYGPESFSPYSAYIVKATLHREYGI